mmetsp:Transcript_29653/g.53972  ORF Transcript_29653/g.53972 Transcript_29653/m.53972 type:complete len:632 (-) Transcript_29653:190-2085(-)
MTKNQVLDSIVDTPLAVSLIVVAGILIGMCLGAVPIWDVIKELAVLAGATVVLMYILGKRQQGFASKDSKAKREPCKAVTSQLPPTRETSSANERRSWAMCRFSKTTGMTRSGAPWTPERAAQAQPNQESRQLSKRPVLPPTFQSTQFDDQADELSHQLLPTENCQNVVQEIAQDIKKTILSVLPYADVCGFTNGEVSRGTAYGVAVPEVDIVVNLPPHILVRTVQAHVSKVNFTGKVDDRRLHKSAIRMCTDLLVTSGGFKFRRSAFRGRDPKVTLMAPRSLDDSGSCIPIDFSVNAATPLCNSVLINAAARVDPRARMLILLVKRWAKDRGIAHAAKGHLMPYAWTLLVIYFLQNGLKGGSLLPPFKYLRLAPGQDATEIAGLAQCMSGWSPPAASSPLAKKRLGQLFKEFIHFYLNEVDWSWEVASIRSGQRSQGNRSIKQLILDTPTGPAVGPTIEDPFMPSENMSEMLTANGLVRMKEELARAQACFESNAPLSEILTQWVPPEQRLRPEDEEFGDEDAEPKESEGGPAKASPPAAGPTPMTELNAPPPAPAGAQVFPAPTMPPWKNRPPTAVRQSPQPGKHSWNCEAPETTANMAKPMMPPPGLWAAQGRPPAPWPTCAPSATSA